jgi:hypothetical protein
MKITKRQLRRIIKEEKRKLIHENQTSGQRALAIYANTTTVKDLKEQIGHLYFDIIDQAMADGQEETEGEDIAGKAILQIVKEFMQTVGHVGDVSYGHGDKRW